MRDKYIIYFLKKLCGIIIIETFKFYLDVFWTILRMQNLIMFHHLQQDVPSELLYLKPKHRDWLTIWITSGKNRLLRTANILSALSSKICMFSSHYHTEVNNCTVFTNGHEQHKIIHFWTVITHQKLSNSCNWNRIIIIIRKESKQ